MVNWDAIILELMQEHGLGLQNSDKDLLLRQATKEIAALIAESDLPTIPREVR
jgi:hypothetical protein